MRDVVEIDDCTAIRETEKALLVELPDGDEVWIPKSTIHDDSEVYQDGDEGTLIVSDYIADEKGIMDYGRSSRR